MSETNQTVVAFKAPASLIAKLKALADAEGATLAGVTRRIVMKSPELAPKTEGHAA